MYKENNYLDFGVLKMDRNSRMLFISNQKVFLRNKEFNLMEYFMRNVDIVLSRTRILEDVWDRNICCPTNTVDVHVSKLRQKLSTHNCNSSIETVHCIGYKFSP